MARAGVYFQGLDSANNAGLWYSDGSVAGTHEVGGVGDAGVSGAAATGLAPSNIFAFGTKILFKGSDSSGDLGLWISDGSAAGTVEIGGGANAGVTGAYSGGLAPKVVATFGSKALFLGADSTGSQALWVTDGTAAGTIELGGLQNAGIAGASSTAFNPTNFVVFGSKVLFGATDSSGYTGLWITDGTTAGTVEIGGLDNAGVTGSPITAFGGIAPADFAVLGGKTLFAWADSSDGSYNQALNLWATDGTAAGTTEIGGLGNGNVVGKPDVVTDLVALGSKVLFEAQDSSLSSSLWASDGTVNGTQELGGLGDKGINGVGSLGLFTNSLTVFGNKAVFASGDSTFGLGSFLWVTDGTTGGTAEIGGLGNLGVKGVYAASPGLQASNLVSIGNKVVFEGYDSQFNKTLWVTDGTLGGTFEIGGIANAGIAGAPVQTSTFNGVTYTSGGLSTTDLVSAGNVAYFHANDASGNLGLWVTDGTVAGTRELVNVTGAISGGFTSNDIVSATVPSTGAAKDDFTGSGTSDIIWQNQSSGVVYEWEMSNGQDNGNVGLGNLSGWTDLGSGHFNGSGAASDLLWQSQATGDVYEWTMAGGQNTGSAYLGNLNGWNEIGIGDFYGAGTDDLLWRNQSTGDVYEWTMSNGQHSGNDVYLGNLSGWNEVGVGDFYGAGTDDLLWQSQSTGAVYEWTMSNGQHTGSIYLGNLSGWSEVGVGDFYGNGTSDLLWQNQTTGDVYEWAMSNGQQTGSVYLGNLSGWSVVGTGDYSGNGVSDIIWQNQSSGATYEWTMSNGQQSGSIYLGNLAGWSGK
jgi:ELWxxDGT repeat protein